MNSLWLNILLGLIWFIIGCLSVLVYRKYSKKNNAFNTFVGGILMLFLIGGALFLEVLKPKLTMKWETYWGLMNLIATILLWVFFFTGIYTAYYRTTVEDNLKASYCFFAAALCAAISGIIWLVWNKKWRKRK